MRNTHFHGIDIDEIDIEDVLKKSDIEDVLWFRDLVDRKLHLDDEVNMYSVADITKKILQYNADDIDKPTEERQPILLYITSRGGEVDSGFQLIDVIENSKTPVYTINLGYWYSMALLIGIAGHKRFATRNSTILLHDGSEFAYGSTAKVQDHIEFMQRLNKRIKDYVLSRTKVTSREYDKNERVEWYMFADEAKQKGFVDSIIGVDCEIDEVI